jgi:hypothetical protein
MASGISPSVPCGVQPALRERRGGGQLGAEPPGCFQETACNNGLGGQGKVSGVDPAFTKRDELASRLRPLTHPEAEMRRMPSRPSRAFDEAPF